MVCFAFGPAEEVSEMDETLGVVSSVIFGPQFDLEIVDRGDERVVMRINSCPMLERAKRLGRDQGDLSKACQSYCKTVVESLNPNHTQRYTMRMCAGDPHCENVIERA